MKKGIFAALILIINTACFAGMPSFVAPSTHFSNSIKSSDNRVTAYYHPDIHGVPNVERFADIWKVIDKHFTTTKRGPGRVEIHYISYSEFVQGIDNKWPGSSDGIKAGDEVYQAYTYIKLGSIIPTIIIESYQPIDDNTFVHEILHHYLEQITIDGSLNNHYLLSAYSSHVEAQIRFMLRKKY